MGDLIVLLLVFVTIYLFSIVIVDSMSADWLLKKKQAGKSERAHEFLGASIGILACVIFYFSVLRHY